MLKISVIILTVMLAFAAVYSMMAIVAPTLIVGDTFQAVAGKSIDSIQDTAYLSVLLGTQRHLGAFALAATLSGVFFLYGAYRKGEAWSWWAVLTVGVLSWGWGLVYNIAIGTGINTIMHIVGTLAYFVGLLLPVGVFFGKKA